MSSQDDVLARLEASMGEESGDIQEQEAPEAVQAEPQEAEGEQEVEVQDDAGLELSAADVAALLGVDEDDILVDENGQPMFRTKIDGEVSQATLKDLVKSYQLERHVNKRSTELGEARKAFEMERQQAMQSIQAQLGQAATLAQSLEAQLMGEFQKVDWDRLRQEDPGEYAARYQQFEQRQRQIQGAKQAAIQQAQAQAMQMQQLHNMRMQQVMQTEAEVLRNRIPEWRDQKVAKQERDELVSYLKDQGYSDQELGNIAFARYIETARKAMLYDKAKQTAPDVKPTKAKPGIRLSPKQRNKAQAEAKKLRLKQTGKVNDLADLLVDRM